MSLTRAIHHTSQRLMLLPLCFSKSPQSGADNDPQPQQSPQLNARSLRLFFFFVSTEQLAEQLCVPAAARPVLDRMGIRGLGMRNAPLLLAMRRDLLDNSSAKASCGEYSFL